MLRATKTIGPLLAANSVRCGGRVGVIKCQRLIRRSVQISLPLPPLPSGLRSSFLKDFFSEPRSTGMFRKEKLIGSWQKTRKVPKTGVKSDEHADLVGWTLFDNLIDYYCYYHIIVIRPGWLNIVRELDLIDHEVMLLWLTDNLISNSNPAYNSRSSTTSSTHSNSLIMPKFTSHAMLR